MDESETELNEQLITACYSQSASDLKPKDLERSKTAPWVSIFEAVLESSNQHRRFFHDIGHYSSVAGLDLSKKLVGQTSTIIDSEAKMNRFMAGMHHDVVYYQVDRKDEQPGIHPDIRERLDRLVEIHENGTDDVSVTFREDLEDSTWDVLEAVNHVFFNQLEAGQNAELPNSVQLKWTDGQNEYLSALFGIAAGLEMGLEPKHILAQSAMIEATIPFGTSDRLVKLKQRLKVANDTLPEDKRLSENEIEQTIEQAQAICNRDVIDFSRPFRGFIENSFDILLENSRGRVCDLDERNANDIDPLQMAYAMTGAPDSPVRGMAGYLGGVSSDSKDVEDSELYIFKRSFFHFADGERNETMEAAAQQNTEKLRDYLFCAASNLTLLIEDYKEHHENRVPTNWGEIREHVHKRSGAEPSDTTYDAHEFFCILGDDIAHEINADVPTGSDRSTIRAYLNQLRAKAADIRDDIQDGNPGIEEAVQETASIKRPKGTEIELQSSTDIPANQAYDPEMFGRIEKDLIAKGQLPAG